MGKAIQLRRVSGTVFIIVSFFYLAYFTPVRIKSDLRGIKYSLGYTLDEKRITTETGEIIWIVEPGEILQPFMKYVIFKGDFSTFDPADYTVMADEYGTNIGILEFNESTPFAKQVVQDRLKKEAVFRVHTVREEEVEKLRMNESMVYYRLRRAILERSIDFIWVQPVKNINMNYVLKKIESEFGRPSPLPIPQNNFANLQFIPFLAILFAIGSFNIVLAVIPLFVVFFSFPLAVSTASIIATVAIYFSAKKKELLPLLYLIIGILTYAALSDFLHINDILQYRGVKISLIALPSLLIVKTFIKEWKWLKKYFPFLLIVVATAGLYYISRSGNVSFVSEFERKLRDSIEGLLWIRPRFKEIVGYPAYFMSLRLKKFKWNFILEIIGAIALLSTFNTFCHIKSPMVVSLYRSMFSILVGYLTYWIVGRTK